MPSECEHIRVRLVCVTLRYFALVCGTPPLPSASKLHVGHKEMQINPTRASTRPSGIWLHWPTFKLGLCWVHVGHVNFLLFV